MKDLPQRRNIRLKGYDYSQNGAYFITICVKDRREFLGKVVGVGLTHPQNELSAYGNIVMHAIADLPIKYKHISVSKYVIMPNHVHLIITINNDGQVNPAPTIGEILGLFKYQTTIEIGIRGFWQRSYHDHIIRNEQEYQQIWQYINENPLTWEQDRFYILPL